MLRAIGIGRYGPELDAGIDRGNRFAMRYDRYLLDTPKYASA